MASPPRDGDLGEKFVDEALRNIVPGIESEDGAGEVVGESAAKNIAPDLLAKRDEAGRAQIVDRERQFYREVIAEETPTGARGDLTGNGEFAGGVP
ncbi:MAG: hypothetical protein H7343_02730 [Undibacterium sp.]|nr:hypothetical protein [Opitutaceae bacterium]